MNQSSNNLQAKLAKSSTTFLVSLCPGIALIFSFPIQPARADVILHAFDWNYSTVAERAQEISEAGYKAVLVTPPSKISQKTKTIIVLGTCDINPKIFELSITAMGINKTS